MICLSIHLQLMPLPLTWNGIRGLSARSSNPPAFHRLLHPWPAVGRSLSKSRTETCGFGRSPNLNLTFQPPLMPCSEAPEETLSHHPSLISHSSTCRTGISARGCWYLYLCDTKMMQHKHQDEIVLQAIANIRPLIGTLSSQLLKVHFHVGVFQVIVCLHQDAWWTLSAISCSKLVLFLPA